MLGMLCLHFIFHVLVDLQLPESLRFGRHFCDAGVTEVQDV